MSATLKVDDFKNPILFPSTPPIIHVQARMYPVGVHFAKKTEMDDYVGAAYKKVVQIHKRLPEGGISVLREGVRVLRRGDHSMCLSPDGPGGPSLRVQEGALYFAKMTGAPIIPVCYSCSHSWFQNRWDRYLVALPFSKITCKLADPIFVGSKISQEDFEKLRKRIEDIMVKQVREMDGEFNLFKVEQDLTSSEFKQKLREEREAKKRAKKNKVR